MKVTRLVLCLGLLGLAKLALAHNQDDASSPPSSSQDSAKTAQVALLENKLQEILQQKDKTYFEKEALKVLIAQLQLAGDPHHEIALLTRPLQESEEKFQKETKLYDKTGKKLQALDKAAFQRINQYNSYEICLDEATIIFQTIPPMLDLPANQATSQMMGQLDAALRLLGSVFGVEHKIKLQKTCNQLAKKFGLSATTLTAGKVAELSKKLQDMLGQKNKMYLEKETILALIEQVGSAGDPQKKLPLLEQFLEQFMEKYERKKAEYKKLGKQLRTLDAQAFQKINQSNISKFRVRDMLASAMHLPTSPAAIARSTALLKLVNDKLDQATDELNDELNTARLIALLAKDFDISVSTLAAGQTAQLSYKFAALIVKKNNAYIKVDALQELRELLETNAPSSPVIAVVVADLQQAEERLADLNRSLRKVGLELKALNEDVYQKINQKNIYEFTWDDLTIVTHKKSELLAPLAQAAQARLDKFHAHEAETEIKAAKLLDRLAAKYGVTELISDENGVITYLPDKIPPRQKCATQVLPPLKAKKQGKKI